MKTDERADCPDDEPVSGSEVTLKDIARLANVSVATASRVVNRTGQVAPAKLQAVQAILDRFSYIPNNAARSLIKKKTMTVGLVVPTLSNPIFAPTIAAIEETLQAAGYGLLIACSHREPEKELVQTRTLIERGVDGMILTGSHRHRDLLPLTGSRGVAVVIQDDPVGVEGAISVSMPDAAGMARAIDYLVERGHRRIGVVTGPTYNTRPIAERVRGAVERLAFHGIACGSDDIEETPDYEAISARLATARLLARNGGHTAIACTGDILAIGVIIECHHAGLVVPHDMSVMGCGDTVMAQFVDPPLSTVHLPFDEIGREAARHLVALMERRRYEGRRVMDFRLVEGRTVRSLWEDRA